jgi:hypothetical protein
LKGRSEKHQPHSRLKSVISATTSAISGCEQSQQGSHYSITSSASASSVGASSSLSVMISQTNERDRQRLWRIDRDELQTM